MLTLMILGSCALSPVLAALLCALSGGNLLKRIATPLTYLAAGFVLALGLGHILPEAMEDLDPHVVGLLALASALVLMLFEMSFTSSEEDHHHRHQALSNGGGALLAGSALHTVCDGMVIASAYMSDPHVGFAVTLAILCHELPHELGDYALMMSLGMTRKAAFCVNLTALFGTFIGGILALIVLSGFDYLLPYALAISASSFIYVALCDLIPRMRRTPGSLLRRLGRIGLIILGAVLCMILTMHE